MLRRHLPNIVSDCGQGEFWAVSPLTWVPVFCGDRASCPIRAPQTVHTYDEETRRVECSARTAEERTPPVGDISASGQSMTDDHGIVALGVELTPGGICHWHIAQRHPRFECEQGYDGNLLVWNESRERILGLGLSSFLDVFSHRFFSQVLCETHCDTSQRNRYVRKGGRGEIKRRSAVGTL